MSSQRKPSTNCPPNLLFSVQFSDQNQVQHLRNWPSSVKSFFNDKVPEVFCKYKILIECYNYYYAATSHSDDLCSPLPLLHLLYFMVCHFWGFKASLLFWNLKLWCSCFPWVLPSVNRAKLSPNATDSVGKAGFGSDWDQSLIGITISPSACSQTKPMLIDSRLDSLANLRNRKIFWRESLISKDLKTNLPYVIPFFSET